MIEVFSTFYRLINHHRQVNKGDGIEQNNQPIGADCRMNGKEKQKAMIHPATPCAPNKSKSQAQITFFHFN